MVQAAPRKSDGRLRYRLKPETEDCCQPIHDIGAQGPFARQEFIQQERRDPGSGRDGRKRSFARVDRTP